MPKAKLTRQSWQSVLGIYRYMAPYRFFFLGGMVCLFFSSVILLAFPYFTGKLIDTSSGAAEWVLKDINQISMALIGILAVQSVFSFLRIYFFSKVSENSMADIRRALFERYMSLPMSFFDQRRSGELLSRITADVSLLQDAFSITLAELFRQVAILVFGVVILFLSNPKLTLFMLLTFPLLVVAGMVFGRFIRQLSKKTQDMLAQANVVVEETLQSVTMVKSFTNERYETHRYGNLLADVVKVALRTAHFRGAFVSFIIFALFGGIVLVLWYGSRLVSTGEITIGSLTSFIIYTMFIGGSIGSLGDIYGSLQRAIGASDRVNEILKETPEGEPESEKPAATPDADQRFKGAIRYENVQFAYPTRQEVPVLKGLSLQIAPGEKVALVGHSGAGKSTIVQLLLRFYQPAAGLIEVDGKPASDYPLHLYRNQIGIVPQEVILFGGTIRENIAYGKPHASEQEIYEAARKAHALGFIESFPDGFQTLVGERGVKLSGGQRQRIAIARAILKDPAILILDEATSSLDAESELLVQQALEELMQNRTTIVIAHRLATIRKVDRIYVVDKGQISEAGTHEQLAQMEKGIYSNLVNLQLS